MTMKDTIYALTISIVLAFSNQANAQLCLLDNPDARKIKNIANSIDSSLQDNSTKNDIALDTIDISLKSWKNKTETLNKFRKSNSILHISYYYKSNELILVKIIEESRRLRELAEKRTEYYYKNEAIFLECEYYKRPTGIALKPGEENDFYGYNKSLNGDFLKGYIIELLEKTAHNTR